MNGTFRQLPRDAILPSCIDDMPSIRGSTVRPKSSLGQEDPTAIDRSEGKEIEKLEIHEMQCVYRLEIVFHLTDATTTSKVI